MAWHYFLRCIQTAMAKHCASVDVVGGTMFCHMRSDVTSEQMVIRFGILIPDTDTRKNEKSFCSKIRVTVFWLCMAEWT